MSFKDLTAKAAAILKQKPAPTAETSAAPAEPKTEGKDVPPKTKTS